MTSTADLSNVSYACSSSSFSSFFRLLGGGSLSLSDLGKELVWYGLCVPSSPDASHHAVVLKWMSVYCVRWLVCAEQGSRVVFLYVVCDSLAVLCT